MSTASKYPVGKARNSSTASRPSRASVTSAPALCSMNSAISMFRSLSSASSTRMPRSAPAMSGAVSCRGRAALSSMRKGRVMRNVVPSPTLLVNVMLPPILSTSALAMGIPSPVPP